MNKVFNAMAEWGQLAVMNAPVVATAMAYALTKDPNFAAFTFMATAVGASDASANVQMAEAGFKASSPKL